MTGDPAGAPRGVTSCLAGDRLDLEAVGIGEVGGVMVLAAGVRMYLGEQQRPAGSRARRREGIDASAVARVKREMVQPRPEPVMSGRGEGG
jgi:hypothetical protein